MIPPEYGPDGCRFRREVSYILHPANLVHLLSIIFSRTCACASAGSYQVVRGPSWSAYTSVASMWQHEIAKLAIPHRGEKRCKNTSSICCSNTVPSLRPLPAYIMTFAWLTQQTVLTLPSQHPHRECINYT